MKNTSMIDRKRTISEFFQVICPIKGLWFGTNKGENGTRTININTNDILVQSSNKKYFNKINRSGAINIKIPSEFVVKRGSLRFDDHFYEFGYFYEFGFECNINYAKENY